MSNSIATAGGADSRQAARRIDDERALAAPPNRAAADCARADARSDRIAALALIVILAIIAMALLAPVLPLASPTKAKFSAKLLPPFTNGHILGTDQLGRDTLSRLVWGARVSLTVGAWPP